jgi:hypothetical protein
MKLEITHNAWSGYYLAKIWDGPDGIDEETFECDTLGECFEKIVVWRTMIAMDYANDVSSNFDQLPN